MQQSMSRRYEPSVEPLHISAKQVFLSVSRTDERTFGYGILGFGYGVRDSDMGFRDSGMRR